MLDITKFLFDFTNVDLDFTYVFLDCTDTLLEIRYFFNSHIDPAFSFWFELFFYLNIRLLYLQ
jgi:hypothetical protein